MAAPSLRTQPIDRRRLRKEERRTYQPGARIGAINRVKAYKEYNNYIAKQEPFRTERTPGTGGFTSNLQAERLWQRGMENARAEDLRQENILPY